MPARALLVSHWSVVSEAATRLTVSTFSFIKGNPKFPPRLVESPFL
jgi:hypothetical protein